MDRIPTVIIMARKRNHSDLSIRHMADSHKTRVLATTTRIVQDESTLNRNSNRGPEQIVARGTMFRKKRSCVRRNTTDNSEKR